MEQDPLQLVSSVLTCLEEVGVALQSQGRRLSGIGISNQRESTVLWDKTTGKCLYNAIAWCDGRAAEVAGKMIDHTLSKNKDDLRPRCGLPINPYFSALKVCWLMDNCDQVREAIEDGRCLFGTVDTWLIWNLTGGVAGGLHVTDVTNASRTMLMNIHSLQWDPYLCSFFNIPQSILPQIRSSSEIYGYIAEGALKGVPICGCLGDQQAALVGQQCFGPGDAKNTYGTGCFLLYNTGQQPVMSRHGMLTTVGYQLGPHAPVVYALEGSVAIGGQSVRWLRDNLEFFKEARDIEHRASSVKDTGDVYFVPAFSGLFAPYWQPDARGVIIGLTNYTTKAHLCRATLEAVCFQSKEVSHWRLAEVQGHIIAIGGLAEVQGHIIAISLQLVLDAMNQDSHLPLALLKVDGGMTSNNLLLQLQADILGIPVVRPDMSEMTALGAAIAAGVGAGVWRDVTQFPRQHVSQFEPQIKPDDRDRRYARWREAVQRSMHWVSSEEHRRLSDAGRKKATAVFSLGLLTGVVVGVGLVLALRRS
eukprot:Em0005g65a